MGSSVVSYKEDRILTFASGEAGGNDLTVALVERLASLSEYGVQDVETLTVNV